MLQILEHSSGPLIAFRVLEKSYQNDISYINRLIVKTAQEQDYIHLYIEIDEIKNLETILIWKELYNEIEHPAKLKKAAVVTRNGLNKMLSDSMGKLNNCEIKYYSERKSLSALKWLMSNGK